MAFTTGNDVNILQASDSTNLSAGAGDDRYILSGDLLTDGQLISISDVEGANTIQLVGGLSITSSSVAADAAQLTLSNGAIITLLGASSFTYQIGGDSLTGTGGASQDYSTFVTTSLGLSSVPAEGEDPVDGNSVDVNEDGSTTPGDNSSDGTYTLTAAADTVDEGATATFNLSTVDVAEGTEVAYTISGVDAADVDGGSLTGTVTVGADGTATISVALLADLATEGTETLTVSLDGTTVTNSVSVNDTSVQPDGESFTLTTGTDSGDDFKGTDGDDTYTAALLTLNSTDSLDGGAGTDTLTAEINSTVAASTTVANVENIELTSFGANTVNLDNITGVTSLTSKNSTGAITLEKTVATTALGFEGSSTNNITANYAAGALAGASDALTVNLNGATSVALDVDAGFESATLDLTGSNSLSTLTVPGVTTLSLTGSGDLALNSSLSGFTTVSATGMTGGLTGSTISSSTGLSSEGFTGSTNGTSVLLGSGADNILFTDATSANKSNTLKMGAGNDTLHITTAGAGASYVFGEAGDDAVTADSIAQTDLMDLGEGSDTLTLTGTTNVGVLRGVENLVVDATAGSSTTINSSDSALTVTVKTDSDANDDVTLATLTAGSTVQILDDSSSTGSIDDAIIGFASTEASTTIDVDAEVVAGDGVDGITVTKVTDLTLDFAKAVALNTGDLDIDNTTTLTINAAKALDLGAGIGNASTDALATVTVTGSDAVDLSAIANSDKLATLTATASKALTVGDIVAAKELDTVTLTGATGVTLGRAGNTTAADDLNTVSVTATTGDITVADGTDLDVFNATKLGTVTLTATAGSITVTDDTDTNTDGADLITADDSTGITVNLSAKTAIKGIDSGADDALLVKNSSDITASLSGTAVAIVDYTVAGSSNDGTVNLTATNTGGLTTTITNDGTAGNSETSTITLGNAVSTKTNAVTVAGTVDTLSVTGGTGKDTVAFTTGTNAIKTGTISLGSTLSTDKDGVDFTNIDQITTDTTGENGIAINLSSSTVTFDSGQSYASSVSAGQAVAYDVDGDEDNTAATSTKVVANGFTYTLSGVEEVTGTGAADYIVANAAGTTINAGAGADTIIGGAGVDTIVSGTGDDVITAGGGADIITLEATDEEHVNIDVVADYGDVIGTFTVGTGKDVLDLNVAVSGAGYNSETAAAALNFGTNGVNIVAADTATASATMTAAQVETAAISAFTNIDANETAYIALTADTDAGSDVFIYHVTADAAGTDIASVAFVAQLSGIVADNLHTDNFADFT